MLHTMNLKWELLTDSQRVVATSTAGDIFKHLKPSPGEVIFIPRVFVYNGGVAARFFTLNVIINSINHRIHTVSVTNSNSANIQIDLFLYSWMEFNPAFSSVVADEAFTLFYNYFRGAEK